MKKTTLLTLLAIGMSGFAQQKTTGDVTFGTSGLTANLTLNKSI